MLFRKTLRGTLVDVNKLSDDETNYIIKNEEGVVYTVKFNKNNAGSSKIDDEIYIAYNHTPFKKVKKGVWLTNNIYLANKKSSSVYFRYTKPFLYQIALPFISMFSLQFLLTFYNVFSYLSVFLITFIGFFFIQYLLGKTISKDINRFIVEKPTKEFFNNYVNNNFSFIEKTINKNLDDKGKSSLVTAINRLDISSTLKLEYVEIIDNNVLSISDIKKIEYYRQKSHIDVMNTVNYN